MALLAGRGTGPQGRVIERDVEVFLAAQAAQPAAMPTASRQAGQRRAPTPLAARMADDLGIDLNESDDRTARKPRAP